MNIPIFQILPMIGVLLCVGCGDDRSNDDSVAPTVAAPKPELVIGKLDNETRRLTVTISNPSDTAIFIPGSEHLAKSVYGAYWFVGDEVLDLPECGTGFWDNSIAIAPGAKELLSVALPLSETELPPTMTLAIVYGGHGEVTREELPSISKDDLRINLLRHPDALMGCRKVEANVSISQTTQAEPDAAGQPATRP